MNQKQYPPRPVTLPALQAADHICKHGVSGEDFCPDCQSEWLDSIERFESDNSAFARPSREGQL